MADEKYVIEFKEDGAAKVSGSIKKIGTSSTKSKKDLTSLNTKISGIGKGFAGIISGTERVSAALMDFGDFAKLAAEEITPLVTNMKSIASSSKSTKTALQSVIKTIQGLSGSHKLAGGVKQFKIAIAGISGAAEQANRSLTPLVANFKAYQSVSKSSATATRGMANALKKIAEDSEKAKRGASGLKAVFQGMGKLAKSIDGLKSSINNLSSIMAQNTDALLSNVNTVTLFGRATQTTKTKVDELAKSKSRLASVAAKIKSVLSSLGRATLKQLGKQVSFVTSKFKAFGHRLNLVAKVGGALGAAFGGREIIRASDAWTAMGNKLKIVTNNQDEFNMVQNELLDISRRVRTELTGNVTLYQRLALQSEKLGASQREMLKFTEAFGMSLAISGAEASEIDSALLQLSQGMSDISIRAQEFNTLMKAAPRFVKVLQDDFELSAKEIKDMGSEGKILSKDVLRAVLKQAGKLREEFVKTTATFSQVGGVIRNVFQELIGRIGDETGIFRSMTSAILEFADKVRANINKITAAVGAASQLIKDMVNDQGIGKTFANFGRLAGDLFLESLVGGFKILKELFVGLARLLVDEIARRMTSEYPKLAKRLGIGQPKPMREQLGELDRGQLLGIAESASSQQVRAVAPTLPEENLANFLASRMEEGFHFDPQVINDALAGIDTTTLMDKLSEVSIEIGDNMKSKLDEFYKANRDGGKSFVETYDEIIAKLAETTQSFDQMDSHVLAYNESLNSAKDATNTFADDFGAAFAKIGESAKSLGTILGESLGQAISKTSDELASFAMTGKADFKSMAQSIIQDMIRMQIQGTITRALTGGFSGTSLTFGQIAGTSSMPANQFGGLATANQPTLVGERGPEIFVPQSAGKVMTNAQSQMGGGAQNIRIVNSVSGDAVLQNSSNSTIDKVVMNSINRNSTALRGVLA